VDRKLNIKTYKKNDNGISYNWPYDYFSLINYAKIKATVKASNVSKKNNPHNNPTGSAGQMGGSY